MLRQQACKHSLVKCSSGHLAQHAVQPMQLLKLRMLPGLLTTRTAPARTICITVKTQTHMHMTWLDHSCGSAVRQHRSSANVTLNAMHISHLCITGQQGPLQLHKGDGVNFVGLADVCWTHF